MARGGLLRPDVLRGWVVQLTRRVADGLDNGQDAAVTRQRVLPRDDRGAAPSWIPVLGSLTIIVVLVSLVVAANVL